MTLRSAQQPTQRLVLATFIVTLVGALAWPVGHDALNVGLLPSLVAKFSHLPFPMNVYDTWVPRGIGYRFVSYLLLEFSFLLPIGSFDPYVRSYYAMIYAWKASAILFILGAIAFSAWAMSDTLNKWGLSWKFVFLVVSPWFLCTIVSIVQPDVFAALFALMYFAFLFSNKRWVRWMVIPVLWLVTTQKGITIAAAAPMFLIYAYYFWFYEKDAKRLLEGFIVSSLGVLVTVLFYVLAQREFQGLVLSSMYGEVQVLALLRTLSLPFMPFSWNMAFFLLLVLPLVFLFWLKPVRNKLVTIEKHTLYSVLGVLCLSLGYFAYVEVFLIYVTKPIEVFWIRAWGALLGAFLYAYVLVGLVLASYKDQWKRMWLFLLILLIPLVARWLQETRSTFDFYMLLPLFCILFFGVTQSMRDGKSILGQWSYRMVLVSPLAQTIIQILVLMYAHNTSLLEPIKHHVVTLQDDIEWMAKSHIPKDATVGTASDAGAIIFAMRRPMVSGVYSRIDYTFQRFGRQGDDILMHDLNRDLPDYLVASKGYIEQTGQIRSGKHWVSNFQEKYHLVNNKGWYLIWERNGLSNAYVDLQ